MATGAGSGINGPEQSVSLASVGRSAVILTGATVVAQVIGFARQLFFAAEVGATSSLDAFLIGMAMPVAMIAVLTGGLKTAIVPEYAEVKKDQGQARARQLVGSVLVWLGLAGLIVSVLLWLLAEPIVELTGPGLAEAGTADDAVRYLRLLTPIVFVSSITSVFLAVTQAESMFKVMAVTIVAQPLIGFAVMVYFWDTLGLDGYVVGMLSGTVVSFAAVLVATLVRRVTPIPRLRPRGVGLGGLLRHAGPLTMSTIVGQINFAFSRAIASLILAGGVSILRYGASLVHTPYGAINPAYRTALYPALVEASQTERRTELATTVDRVLRFSLVFFVPLAGLTAAVAPLATAIAYDRGSFQESDLWLTAQVVAVAAPLIVTWTAHPALAAALNARRKGTALLSSAVLQLVVMIVFTLPLGYAIGVAGVAAAESLTSVVVVLFTAYRLKAAEPDLALRPVWRTFYRSSLAILPSALIFGLPIWAGFMPDGIVGRVVMLVVVGVAGLSSYYALARRLGLPEASLIPAFARNTLRRVVRRLPVRS